MCAKTKIDKQEAQNPLILRCHRLMEAFAKSDDERDFYIDRMEGFLVYVDLDKPQSELEILEKEVTTNNNRYCKIPKMSFYEIKKIMEGFVNEKVYDIDTKEKLLDIIQSKEARENFLEFIYDHHSEQEKWQQFYQERSRIRIIEWLRQNHFHFVFEEDLDMPKQILEKLKQFLFDTKVGKDILNARKTLVAKAKTYYSNEALNPRPKRGRPPKQAVKLEIEPQVAIDIYTTVPLQIRPFLFTPDMQSSLSFSYFSSKFEDEIPTRRLNFEEKEELSLQQKLASLKSISQKWVEKEPPLEKAKKMVPVNDFALDDEDDFDDEDETKEFFVKKPKMNKIKQAPPKAARAAKSPVQKKPIKATKSKLPTKSTKPKLKKLIPTNKTNNKQKVKRIMPKIVSKKAKPKVKPKEIVKSTSGRKKLPGLKKLKPKKKA